MLKAILNEDFIDQLDNDELVSPHQTADEDNNSYPFVFLFGIETIKKKLTREEYIRSIKRLYNLLKRSFDICVKIDGFQPFDTMTNPVYLRTTFTTAKEEEVIDGIRFMYNDRYDITHLVSNISGYRFAVRFMIDTRSAQSIAQPVVKIASIFYKTVRVVYGNTVKPISVALAGVGDKIFDNGRYFTTISEEEAGWLENYDLRGNVVLWSLMKKMDPERYDIAKAQREAWDYLYNMHNKYGHTPFIDKIAKYFTVQPSELTIDDDKKNKTVTFMLPNTKRFTIKEPMEFMNAVEYNNYKVKIKGGSCLSLECHPDYLKKYAEAIEGSTINQVRIAPCNISYEAAEATIGKKGKPIDLTAYFQRNIKVELQAQPVKDPGTSNKWWDAKPLDVRFKVTSGIKEYRIVFYTKKVNSPVQ